jgi:hypothetical protein
MTKLILECFDLTSKYLQLIKVDCATEKSPKLSQSENRNEMLFKISKVVLQI